MAIKISTGLSNAILDAAFNAGSQGLFNSGILEGRNGTRPTSANDAPVGTVIFSMTLPADAFANASARAIAIAGTWQDASADATGTPTWFRIRQAADAGTTNTTDERIDGDIGQGSGDLSLDSTSITAGQQITVTSGSLTLPEG